MRKELTSLRSLHYSKRHRVYPESFIYGDIDGIEYNGDDPICIIEEKHPNIKEIDLSTPQMRRNRKLADRLNIPYIVLVPHIMYQDEYGSILPLQANDVLSETYHIQFTVYPANGIAQGQFPHQLNKLTEYEWVSYLSSLRGETFVKKELYYSELNKYVSSPRLSNNG